MRAEYIDHMGTDLSVVNSARVSFNKKSAWWIEYLSVQEYEDSKYFGDPEWTVFEEFYDPYNGVGIRRLSYNDRKLINYLASHGHKSPFNHTFVTLQIKAPIFVARQLVKHKFMPINEVSRRYVSEDPEFYQPDYWRAVAPDKKQGSSNEEVVDLRMQGFGVQTVQDAKIKHDFHSVDLYKDMLSAGVCEEQARMVLPLNTYTEWYWSGTLGAWADMYNLRAKPDTQLETQEIAKQCGSIISRLFPVSWEALTNGKN